jgi:hypothetical protein
VACLIAPKLILGDSTLFLTESMTCYFIFDNLSLVKESEETQARLYTCLNKILVFMLYNLMMPLLQKRLDISEFITVYLT